MRRQGSSANWVKRFMKKTTYSAKGIFLIGLIGLDFGCVLEGRYDSKQHQYYHESAWHDCGERDEHCR